MSINALWQVDELVAATGGTLQGDVDGPLTGVSIDSRTLMSGDIFIAINGDARDGHDYVAQALESGAGLAVVSAPDQDMARAGPLLVVDDTLKAMEAMGVAARARSSARIVAITGSVGKTSTKEALRQALGRSGKTHASAASYNNHWGVPLSLARLPPDAEYGVFEVGMNHPGEITPLVAMIRPHVALITTVAPVHLGFFKSVKQIAEAKAEIFSGVVAPGTAIINRDNAHFELLQARAKAAGIENICSFGADESSDIQLVDAVYLEANSSVQADIYGEQATYKIGVPGRHHVINSLGCLCAVKALGADLALGALAFETLSPPKGRGARRSFKVPGGDIVVIDESYNANPASMAAGLEVLGNSTLKGRGRRIAVLGDMLELGARAPELHCALADLIEQTQVDLVYACGPNMVHLWDILPKRVKGAYAMTSADLAMSVCDNLVAGDVIMVKGSLGSAMGLIVEALINALGRIETQLVR
jgi:UDP-N-acetylmuramoyl-tripeptide--D-alanyl-D-alanine ligase